MRSRDMLLVAIAVPALLSSAAYAAGTAEQRCTELGASCICSEPLDFSQGIPAAPNFDPPDSEGAGAKECNEGGSLQHNNAQSTVTATSVGLTGPTRVLAVQMHDNLALLDLDRTFTNGTWCTRNYFRYSSNFPNFNPPQTVSRIKGPRMERPDNTNHPGVETEWDPFSYPHGLNVGTGYSASAFGDPPGPTLSSTGGSITFDQCSSLGHWCRLEMCYDHNEDGQNKLRWRVRLVDTVTGEREDWNALSPVAQTSARSGEITHLIKTYTEGFNDAGTYEYFSHVMVAIKSPADPSFWIGPAREVTSDVDSGGTGPAPAPSAPVLLP